MYSDWPFSDGYEVDIPLPSPIVGGHGTSPSSLAPGGGNGASPHLGAGNFCVITRARRRSDGRVVAVKWNHVAAKPNLQHTLLAELTCLKDIRANVTGSQMSSAATSSSHHQPVVHDGRQQPPPPCGDAGDSTSSSQQAMPWTPSSASPFVQLESDSLLVASASAAAAPPAPTAIGIALEHAAYGNLVSFRSTYSSLTERQMQRIAGTLLSATAQLHDQGYAHRDVKPHNVLVFPAPVVTEPSTLPPHHPSHSSHGAATTTLPPPFRVALADFGLAVRIVADLGWCRQNTAGDYSIMDPSFQQDHRDGMLIDFDAYCKNDVYAVGLTIYFVMTGRTLARRDLEDLRDGFATWPQLLPLISESGRDLLSQLLDTNKARRPTADDALQHPWLQRVTAGAAAGWSREESLGSRQSSTAAVALTPPAARVNSSTNLSSTVHPATECDDVAVQLGHVVGHVAETDFHHHEA